MRFPYREIEPGKSGPIVDVRFFGRLRTFCFEAFLDSGADFSIFDVSAARLIGLNHTKGKRLPITVGDGDKMSAYLHHLSVSFAGEKFVAPVCFSSQLGAGFNLIGRSGFFQRFRICFHEKEKFTSIVRTL